MKLSFFTRALRLTISVVAVLGFYLPFFNSTRGANVGLIVSAVGTAVWYILDNPFGIDNIYIALIVPAIVMFFEKVLTGGSGPIDVVPAEPEAVAETAQAGKSEGTTAQANK